MTLCTCVVCTVYRLYNSTTCNYFDFFKMVWSGSSATLPSTEPIDVESNTTTETYDDDDDDDDDPQIQSDALHVTLTDGKGFQGLQFLHSLFSQS